MYSFTKQQRLLTAKEFKTVLNSSKKFKLVTEALIIYALPQDKAQLGLAITRKNINTAVQRNTIKRVIRENFRLNYQNLPKVAVIIMSRSALVGLTKVELRTNIDLIWQQLRKKFPSLSAVS